MSDLSNYPDANFSGNNLTFITTNLHNYQSLIPDTQVDGEVYLINPQQNGIEQITEVLENYSNLESISIFSHGDVGLIELGSVQLSNNNLDVYQEELATWGNALSPSGDLILYGCNVGGEVAGLDFVEGVAAITGADVAASDDLTGNFALGGDWTLEIATGTIETTTFVIDEYGGLLAISQQDLLTGVTADFNGDGKADILRQEKGHWDDDDISSAQIFISTGNGFNQINLSENLNIKGDETNLYLGDFNGDGRSDILRQEKAIADDDNINTASLLISTGNGFNEISLPENLWFHGDFNNLHIGDFNGDGKSDVFRQMKLSWDNNHTEWTGALFTSTGTGFIAHTIQMGESHNLGGDNANLYVGDFNGDGKSDLLRQEKGSWDDDNSNTANLLISNGTNFNVFNIPEGFDLKGDYTNLYVGDFNGDGKDDLFRQEKSTWDNNNSNTANLLISNGTSFNKYVLPESFDLKGDYTNLYVGDYNGDGKDDLFRQEKNAWDNDDVNTTNLLLSTGSGFNKIVLGEELLLGGDYTNIQVGDFSGDGKVDLIRQEKGWYNYNDDFTAQLLVSTGNSFNANSIYGASLNGNFSNIITNNRITQYLANNDTNSLKFNFTYDNGVTTEQIRAFEFAGRMWSELLRDNVTVNIHISMVDNDDLPNNTLGGAIPFFHQGTSYTQFKNELYYDSDEGALNYVNNDDATALNNLDSGTTFQTAAPNNSNYGVWRNFDQVAVTRANAKALGLIDNDDTALDGTIVMNDLVGTGVSWQYDYFSNIVGANKIDFTTVAMHEIGHTLGFVSVVDGLSNDNYQDQTILNESVTALDLFRFMGQNFRSIRTGHSAYFSIDGGITNLARTAGGVDNIGGDFYADGYQASHWKNEDNVGIMDPVLETDARRQIGELDLRALDVIGWDRKYAANTWGIMASEAWNAADDTENINRNVEVGAMLQDWRWARRGARSGFAQEGNIAQFLAQEGFFSVGSFRESFDFSSVNSEVENSSLVITDNSSNILESQVNNNFNSTDNVEFSSEVKIQHLVEENVGIDYEAMLALVTNNLSEYELSQLSLEDLGQLIEQQLTES